MDKFLLIIKRLSFIGILCICLSCNKNHYPTVWVNLRKSPSSYTDTNIIRAVGPRERLKIIDRKGNWCKVLIIETREKGWIYNKYIKHSKNKIKSKNSDINLAGILISSLLSTLFGYFLVLCALNAPGGEGGDPLAGNAGGSGVLFLLFTYTNLYIGIPIWKIILSTIVSITVASICDIIVFEGELNLWATIGFFLLGVLLGLMLIYLSASSGILPMTIGTIRQIQNILSF